MCDYREMHLIDKSLKSQTICINRITGDLEKSDYTIFKTYSMHTNNLCTKLNSSQGLQRKKCL
jgi:hypothetical protein